MIGNALLAWLHYLGFALMLACLVLEHRLFRPTVDAPTLRVLARIDGLYGMLAGVQIGTGIARMFLEKGAGYYLHNPVFHAKLGLFVLVGLLSIYPTVSFIRLRRQAGSGVGPVEEGTVRRVVMVIRAELLGMLLLPLLAALMARGVGA